MKRWSSTRRGVTTLGDDVFHYARAAAAERGCLTILLGFEAGHRLLERRELDDNEAMECFRSFHDAVAPAASEHLAAVARDDRRHAIGVLLVLDGVVDLRPGDPIRGHGGSSLSALNLT